MNDVLVGNDPDACLRAWKYLGSWHCGCQWLEIKRSNSISRQDIQCQIDLWNEHTLDASKSCESIQLIKEVTMPMCFFSCIFPIVFPLLLFYSLLLFLCGILWEEVDVLYVDVKCYTVMCSVPKLAVLLDLVSYEYSWGTLWACVCVCILVCFNTIGCVLFHITRVQCTPSYSSERLCVSARWLCVRGEGSHVQ